MLYTLNDEFPSLKACGIFANILLSSVKRSKLRKGNPVFFFFFKTGDNEEEQDEEEMGFVATMNNHQIFKSRT